MNKFLLKIKRSISNILIIFKLELIPYLGLDRTRRIKTIKKIRDESDMLLTFNEAFTLYKLIESTNKIEGEIAEVGVYKGGSAKLISKLKRKKKFHLFDTFEGLPKLSNKDNKKQFIKGQYIGRYEQVKKYLKSYSNVFLYKGFFPDTANPIKGRKFSFVHLDVDIYSSTFDSLKFFYPRMVTGGVILSHDYANSVGVKRAFDTFLKDKKEIIIETVGSQCIVVKL